MPPEIRTIRYNNPRFKEGSTVQFNVLKRVELSANEAYFVLLDPLGFKILLPAEDYTGYRFTTGDYIQCKIDKVNCSGQVFLEPRHPFYAEGEIYEFEITGYNTVSEEGKLDHYILELADALGMSCSVTVKAAGSENYLKAGKIRCLVTLIKKARLYLRPESELNISLIPGSYYPFLIRDIKGDNFILTDAEGNYHHLEAMWYGHYNLKQGDTVNCKFLHYAEDGTLTLEPENPFYKEGNSYKFPVRYFRKMEYADGSFEITAVALDIFGEEAHIKVPAAFDQNLSELHHLTARVDRIRRSRVHATAIL